MGRSAIFGRLGFSSRSETPGTDLTAAFRPNFEAFLGSLIAARSA